MCVCVCQSLYAVITLFFWNSSRRDIIVSCLGLILYYTTNTSPHLTTITTTTLYLRVTPDAEETKGTMIDTVPTHSHSHPHPNFVFPCWVK